MCKSFTWNSESLDNSQDENHVRFIFKDNCCLVIHDDAIWWYFMEIGFVLLLLYSEPIRNDLGKREFRNFFCSMIVNVNVFLLENQINLCPRLTKKWFLFLYDDFYQLFVLFRDFCIRSTNSKLKIFIFEQKKKLFFS